METFIKRIKWNYLAVLIHLGARARVELACQPTELFNLHCALCSNSHEKGWHSDSIVVFSQVRKQASARTFHAAANSDWNWLQLHQQQQQLHGDDQRKSKLSYKLIKHSKLPRPCCKECKTDEHESCRKCLIFAIMKIVRRTIFISSSSCAQKSWKKFSYLSLSPRTLIFVLPRRDVRFFYKLIKTSSSDCSSVCLFVEYFATAAPARAPPTENHHHNQCNVLVLVKLLNFLLFLLSLSPDA